MKLDILPALKDGGLRANRIKVQQGLTAKDYHELFAVAREKIHPLATIVLSPEP